MKIKFNQNGHVQLLPIVAVIAIFICAAGFSVYKHQNQSSKNQTNHSTKQAPVLFTDPTKSYTFTYPANWKVKTPKPIKDWSDDAQLTWISFPGSPVPDPMNVSFDKTPKQAKEQSALLETYKKSSNNEIEELQINGYKAFHEKIEFGEKGKIDSIEDRYLIVNKDNSSLYYIIGIKSNDDELGVHYDATNKTQDFLSIVKSTKFLN